MSFADIAAFLSDPDRGLFLGIPAVAAIAALAWGLVWTYHRLSRLPARRRPTHTTHEREVCPPTRLERILRAVLTDEVDAMEDRYRRIHGERD